jgi:hypothetical protein
MTKRYRLRTLGGVCLEGADGPLGGAATQHRRLALLALIAASGDLGVSRDRLIAVLWPESEPAKARQVLTHLAQIEMVFANRLRFALAQDNYVVQPFEQDDWMRNESSQTALAALETYLSLRRMNLALCQSLTPAQRAKTFTHPEYGVLDVNWMMAWAAGHERNHLPQIDAVAASSALALAGSRGPANASADRTT